MSNVRIRKISDFFDVTSSKRVFQSEWKSKGVPFYRAREIVTLAQDGVVENELYISEEMYKDYSSKYGSPKAGDILVTGVGTLGICYQVKENDRFYFKDGNIIWLKKRKEVCSDLIEYAFKSTLIKKQIEARANAAVVGTLTITTAKEIQIPLPPLETQQRIAAILGEADALRKKTQQLIDSYNELAQSIFLDMFGDPVKNPKGFKIGKIRDLTLDVKYGTSAKASDIGKYTYLRMNNLTYSGYMDYSNLKYIDVDNNDLEKYSVRKGDLLFNRTNSKELVGKTAIVDSEKEMVIAGYLIRVRFNNRANPYFVWGYLNSVHGKLVLINMCKSIVGMANINAQELQGIKIHIPPVNLQNQFAEKIALIEKQKELARLSLKESEDLFNTLLQKAFKGELELK